ncbi:hypothetical protein C2G38_2216521 [Gigaspora rosea]|uniref:Uncharacterized protein n=1 Tax=Gigaspora rosea TaxID=44941 RepID=A0A397UHP8_9GLOM|nr:hypothetical protein C2G38_2216521 [Gigaspora rosea]
MTKITSETRFRKFNFTLYERLETIMQHISNIFNTKTCPFYKLQFQFEPNNNSKEPGRYHAQGYARLRTGKQLKAGSYDSKTKKGSGIKKIFEANPHLEFANGTEEQCLAYTGKEYNRCKNPNHQPCKCDLFDLTKICKKCNENCERTFAQIDKNSKIAGPFTWVFDESKFSLESAEEKNTNNKKQSQITKTAIELTNRLLDDLSGKGYLFSLLFPNAYERKNNSGRFWEGYESSNEEILINEFKGVIKYLEMLNLLDRKEYSVQIKGSSSNFCPKVIGFSANTNIRFVYDFVEDEHLKPISERKINNTKLFSAFVNRLDYVIEFKKFRDDEQTSCRDECLCCQIRMIFHKGNLSEFFDFNFEIEFNYNVTEERAREITKNSYGRMKKADKILYWQKYYSVDKSKYILSPVETYYPQKKEKNIKDIIIETTKKEQKKDLIPLVDTYYLREIDRQNLKENPLESKNGLPSHICGLECQVESSKKQKLDNDFVIERITETVVEKQYKELRLYSQDSSEINDELSENLEYDSSLSIYNSDDSDYTKKQKKKNKILGKRKKLISNDDFDYDEEMELDIANEELYEQFLRENKNNSLFSGFNRMLKNI